MDKILTIQNRHWRGEPYQGVFDRFLVNKIKKRLQSNQIEVLLGIRRSGKSTIFRLLINQIMASCDSKSILYLNLDDPYFVSIYKDPKALYQLAETSEKITGVKVRYLFLDEIQNVKDWQKFVKSVYDSELFQKIFITGSNSALLSGDYASLLSGRYIAEKVYTFSFAEILSNQGLIDNLTLLEKRPQILATFENILKNGSFPEVIKTDDPDLKREILTSYFDTIVIKDCIASASIRETKIFKELAHYLITNSGSPYSYNSLARAIGSNENTIREFVSLLEESFLLSELKNYSYSLKQQSKARKKIYCADNGLIDSISFSFSANKGQMFENLVYTELLKYGYKNIFFFSENKECDFIVTTVDGSKIAIQVCYFLNDQNREREIGGLKVAMTKYAIPRGIIVTAEKEEELSGNTSVMPFWKLHLLK